MNRRDAPDEDAAPTGATTAGRGTAFAVDVSGNPRSWAAITLLLAGPVIWSVHFMVVYLVVEAGCTGDGPGLSVFDPPVPTVVTLAATAVAAVACLASAAWGYRWWRAARDQPAEDGDGVARADRGGTLAFAGFVLSLLGLVEVLFVGLPALVLPAC